jgi:tetratricopeptide (TPR) repeat protein
MQDNSTSANPPRVSVAIRRPAWCRLAALIFCAALTSPTLAHTDLELQIEALGEQIAVDPGNPELLARRGDLYRRHQNYQAAAIDFDTARNSQIDYPLLNFYEGRLLVEVGDGAGAERLLSHYVASHPEHGVAWVLRGKANMQLMQTEAAAQYFTQAIQTSDRPSPELYRLYVLSLAAAGGSGVETALQAVDAGLERFSMEMSLLGLGFDIALASNMQAKAASYLDRLPQPLQRLPQWAARFEASDCLAATEPAAQASCLQQVNDGITRQVEELTGSRTDQ